MPWNVLIKVAATVLGIAVICICYLDFTAKPPEDAQETVTSAPTAAQSEAVETSMQQAEIKVDPANTEMLPDDAYAYCEASSTYTEAFATHIVTNLLDDNPKTNWAEGVPGNGEGEYVDFEFVTEELVAGFVIAAGNHSSDEFYDKNARPKGIVLTFSDGSTKEFALKDVKREQTVFFNTAIPTKSIRLTIRSVYPGSEWEDTVISEFSVLVQK